MVKKKKHKKFQVFIWNSKIHNTFLSMLVFLVILLSMLTIVQNMYIKELKFELYEPDYQYQNVQHDTILLEDFISEKGITEEGIASVYKYFQENDYENLYLGVGFIQATITECKEGGCFKVTYRFNQRQGKYVDVISEKIE